MTGRIAALSLLLLGAGCATTSTAYLARVNDELITGNELRLEFARHHYAMEEILGEEQEVHKYVERLVDRRLFVQEAYRLGLQDQPEVREAVARFRGQKMVEAYVKEQVDDRAGVAEEELRAAHAQMTSQAEALQLVVATQAEAEAALAALAKGADFDALARERSIVESSKRGGLILVGYGAEEALERALAGLKEGELSAPFKADAGWEVVRLEKRKTVEPPPYDKVAPKIRSFLQKRRRAALEQELYGPLWTRYGAAVLDCAPTVDDLKAAAAARSTAPCATWQGGTITVEALARRVKLDQLGRAPEHWPELRKAVIEDLVARELVQREAEAAGYGARPEIVEKVRVYQDDQVESELYRKYVIKDVTVSDADVTAYFEAHRDLFTDDAQYELAQIVVATAEEAGQVEERLGAARQPFAEVATAFSTDEPSAANGGRVGLIDRKRLTGEFAPVAALKEGEVSAPLQSKAGFHVVKVLSIKPPRPLPFQEVAGDARKRALEEKQTAEIQRWVGQLRAAARIEINEAGIRAYSRERTRAMAKEQAAKAAARPAEPEPPTAPVPAPLSEVKPAS